ncbi:MAG TPA: hypothetical protein PKO22_09150 [Treponemataceae bacterium]|nr:hypothetical protein [Treponemataceae bacterium]
MCQLFLHKVLDVINYKCWYYETAVNEGSEEAVRKMPVPPELTQVRKRGL